MALVAGVAQPTEVLMENLEMMDKEALKGLAELRELLFQQSTDSAIAGSGGTTILLE